MTPGPFYVAGDATEVCHPDRTCRCLDDAADVEAVDDAERARRNLRRCSVCRYDAVLGLADD